MVEAGREVLKGTLQEELIRPTPRRQVPSSDSGRTTQRHPPRPTRAPLPAPLVSCNLQGQRVGNSTASGSRPSWRADRPDPDCRRPPPARIARRHVGEIPVLPAPLRCSLRCSLFADAAQWQPADTGVDASSSNAPTHARLCCAPHYSLAQHTPPRHHGDWPARWAGWGLEYRAPRIGAERTAPHCTTFWRNSPFVPWPGRVHSQKTRHSTCAPQLPLTGTKGRLQSDQSAARAHGGGGHNTSKAPHGRFMLDRSISPACELSDARWNVFCCCCCAGASRLKCERPHFCQPTATVTRAGGLAVAGVPSPSGWSAPCGTRSSLAGAQTSAGPREVRPIETGRVAREAWLSLAEIAPVAAGNC